MKYICHEIGLEIDVKETFFHKLYLNGLEHYPNEYGGILIGRYSSDQKICILVDTITPISYKPSNFLFERNNEGLIEKLTEVYLQEHRLIYLGEWHTHPNGVPTPSDLDKRAMKQISNDEKVAIMFPVLVILGITKESYTTGVYIQFNNSLLEYVHQQG